MAVSSVARAEPIDQDNQLVFGAAGAWIPAQNNLSTDVLAIGHYVSFTHAIECFHVGLRVAASVDTGLHQLMVDPSGFIGLHVHAGRLTLRLDAGTGPLLDFGDGFPFVVIDHSYAHAAFQLRIGKAAVIELAGGPGFIIGPSVVGLMAEGAVGVGWNF